MHYLLDDRFGLAVENYLKREGQSMRQYLNELEDHQPIKKARK
jgi:predicted N-acyltransferase